MLGESPGPSVFADGPGNPSYKYTFFRRAKDDYLAPSKQNLESLGYRHPTMKFVTLVLTGVG